MALANMAEALVKIVCKRGYGGLPVCDPLDALEMITEALDKAYTEGAAEERETWHTGMARAAMLYTPQGTDWRTISVAKLAELAFEAGRASLDVVRHVVYTDPADAPRSALGGGVALNTGPADPGAGTTMDLEQRICPRCGADWTQHAMGTHGYICTGCP